jgi:predicted DNA-binding protein (MmcQ/YjbR family)
VTWDDVLTYCLAKPGAWQDEPWEADVVVKVGLSGPTRESADEWLHRYPDDATVMAYIGRSGWNSLRVGAGIPDDELLEAIESSYEAVVSKLPKKQRPPLP